MPSSRSNSTDDDSITDDVIIQLPPATKKNITLCGLMLIVLVCTIVIGLLIVAFFVGAVYFGSGVTGLSCAVTYDNADIVFGNRNFSETAKIPTTTMEPETSNVLSIFNSTEIGLDFKRDNRIPQYLQRLVQPVEYDVNLRIPLPVDGKINDDTFKVSGTVRIDFEVLQDTDRMFFNAHDIDIIKVKNNDYDDLTVHKGLHPDVRFIDFEEFLVVGRKYYITIYFNSTVNNDMQGLYYSSHFDSAGVRHYTASTQFEAQGARQVFPCLDEPYYRSSFRFVIEHYPRYSVYSNMPIATSMAIPNSRFVQTTFEPLRNAPTYILALLLADDYSSKSQKSTDNITISVITRNEFINDTEQALTSGVRAMNWFNKNLKISYGLPKMDLAAIIRFSAGAMENYGLNTYRENLLLNNPNYSSATDMVNGWQVILHEIAHQWFGNLVTPLDWSQTFMSEGFANFFQTYAFFAITSDTSMHSNYAVKTTQVPAMLHDSLYVHPNDHSFRNAYELKYHFNVITYNRASSVFNMVREMVGNEIFFNALRNYLKTNSNGHAHWMRLATALRNSIPEDSDLAKIDFHDFFRAWFTFCGFPAVHVHQDGTNIILRAKLYARVKNPIHDPRWKCGESWPIPIWYRISSSPNQLKFVMMAPNSDLVINVPSENDVIFVNSENHGYYLVYYGNLYENVVHALTTSNSDVLISSLIRFQTDSCFFLLTGEYDPKMYFNTISKLAKAKMLSTDALQACNSLIGDHLKKSTKYSLFQKFILTYLERAADGNYVRERIYDAEADESYAFSKIEEVEQVVGKLSCKIDPNECRQYQLANFEKYVYDKCNATDQTANCSGLKEKDRLSAYCQAAKSGNIKHFKRIVNLYAHSRNPFEQSKLLTGLLCTTDSYRVSKLFTTMTTRNEFVNDGDRFNLLGMLHSGNSDLVRKLFITNINQIVKDFPTLVVNGFKIIFTSHTKKDYIELLQFLSDNPEIASRYTFVFRDIINESRAYLEFNDNVLPRIEAFLEDMHTEEMNSDSENYKLCVMFGSCS